MAPAEPNAKGPLSAVSQQSSNPSNAGQKAKEMTKASGPTTGGKQAAKRSHAMGPPHRVTKKTTDSIKREKLKKTKLTIHQPSPIARNGAVKPSVPIGSRSAMNITAAAKFVHIGKGVNTLTADALGLDRIFLSTRV